MERFYITDNNGNTVNDLGAILIKCERRDATMHYGYFSQAVDMLNQLIFRINDNVLALGKDIELPLTITNIEVTYLFNHGYKGSTINALEELHDELKENHVVCLDETLEAWIWFSENNNTSWLDVEDNCARFIDEDILTKYRDSKFEEDEDL